MTTDPPASAIIAGIVANDAVIAKIIALLSAPHPCPSCGDLTCASLCPACQEWAALTLTMEPRYVG